MFSLSLCMRACGHPCFHPCMYFYTSTYVCVCVCVCVSLCEQLWALHLNSRSHGQSEGGPQGEEAMGEGTDARQTLHLPLPFHLSLTASNNKLFHSGIFAAGRPQTLKAPTRSRFLIQCSVEKLMIRKWLFYPCPFPYLPPRSIAPLHVLSDSVFLLTSK